MSTNINNFLRDMEEIEQSLMEKFSDISELSINIYTDQVVQATPYGKPDTWVSPAHEGYTPGSLKNAWTTSIDHLGGFVAGGLVENDLPYAGIIEFGSHSKQAPRGMARITAMSAQDIVDKAVILIGGV